MPVGPDGSVNGAHLDARRRHRAQVLGAHGGERRANAVPAVPDRLAAEMLLPMLKDEKLAKDTALALLNLSDALRRGDRATARKLAQTVRDANLSDDLNKRADSTLNRR